MRQKLDATSKRKHIIGVKVDEITKKKIEYIADSNGEPTSTYLYNLINERIEQYTKDTKINWNEEI